MKIKIKKIHIQILRNFSASQKLFSWSSLALSGSIESGYLLDNCHRRTAANLPLYAMEPAKIKCANLLPTCLKVEREATEMHCSISKFEAAETVRILN